MRAKICVGGHDSGFDRGQCSTHPLTSAVDVAQLTWVAFCSPPFLSILSLLRKDGFLLHGTKAEEKLVFGDLGSCFRAQMVLGPMRGVKVPIPHS